MYYVTLYIQKILLEVYVYIHVWFNCILGWDTEFATKVYQEQVKELAERQVGMVYLCL